MSAGLKDVKQPSEGFDINIIFSKKKDVENSLKRVMSLLSYDENIRDAIEYVLFSGGKRIRPILGILVLEMFDSKRDVFIDILSLIEFIHSYSLVHDDLPCMDNDDLRRGKPTLHCRYNPEFASYTGSIILEGVMYALIELLESTGLSKEKKGNVISLFDEHIGFDGMVGGQIMDMKLNSRDQLLEQKYIHMIELKTSRLIELSVNTACILSGADSESRSQLSSYAKNIGILFQIIDDLLEVISDQNTIGKSVESDVKNDKVTAVKLFGRSNVEMFADSLYYNAKKSVESFNEKGRYLAEFAKFLRFRER